MLSRHGGGDCASESSLVDMVLEEYFEHHRLSSQQRRVLRLYLSGVGDKAIADHLGCSPSTVSEHWRRIVRKTSATCKATIVAKIVEFLRAHVETRVPR